MTVNIREQLGFLHDLQKVDILLRHIQLDIDALPQQLEGPEREYQTVKQLVDTKLHELEEVEKLKRHDERELQASEAHLKERETKLYSIKTTKEYQAAVKEIADAKKLNREREDSVLQCMERIEQLQKEKTQLEPELADKEARYRKLMGEVREKELALRRQMEESGLERPQILQKIEVEVMRKYEFVQRRYADVLAKVEGGVCSGCSMNVPPQVYNEILHFKEIKTCPSCRRLLYVE